MAFLLACLWSAAGGADERLAEIRGLAAAGALELALELIDEHQPSAAGEPEGWAAWERERVELLRERGQWERLARRLQRVPEDVDPAFRRWARGQRADALLAAGKPAEARGLLAQLVWGGPPPAELAELRRTIIRTYLAEGRSDDALAAQSRYSLDYRDHDPLLRARVLLDSGRPADAVAALRPLRDAQAAPLLLLARLRSGAAPAAGLLTQARTQAAEADAASDTALLHWAVAAEAAERAGDALARAEALEQVFGHPGKLPPGLFRLAPADLWHAYADAARRLGNEAQLLVGDDAAWFDRARRQEGREPAASRALLGFLARHGVAREAREQAHRLLLGHLLARPRPARLLGALYLDSGVFGGPERLPEPARRRLADFAVADGDLTLASELLRGLAPPPEVADRFTWELRRAKVFLLAGEPDAAVPVLEALLLEEGMLEADSADRLTQLLFDLQNVGEHDAALRLLGLLRPKVAEAQTRRELVYWMADSRLAQGRHRDAAVLYLQSALALGGQSMDPWGQTARYQAAKALATAGMPADARNLLQQLLAAAADPARRAVLRRDLEQLERVPVGEAP